MNLRQRDTRDANTAPSIDFAYTSQSTHTPYKRRRSFVLSTAALRQDVNVNQPISAPRSRPRSRNRQADVVGAGLRAYAAHGRVDQPALSRASSSSPMPAVNDPQCQTLTTASSAHSRAVRPCWCAGSTIAHRDGTTSCRDSTTACGSSTSYGRGSRSCYSATSCGSSATSCGSSTSCANSTSRGWAPWHPRYELPTSRSRSLACGSSPFCPIDPNGACPAWLRAWRGRLCCLPSCCSVYWSCSCVLPCERLSKRCAKAAYCSASSLRAEATVARIVLWAGSCHEVSRQNRQLSRQSPTSDSVPRKEHSTRHFTKQARRYPGDRLRLPQQPAFRSLFACGQRATPAGSRRSASCRLRRAIALVAPPRWCWRTWSMKRRSRVF